MTIISAQANIAYEPTLVPDSDFYLYQRVRSLGKTKSINQYFYVVFDTWFSTLGWEHPLCAHFYIFQTLIQSAFLRYADDTIVYVSVVTGYNKLTNYLQ